MAAAPFPFARKPWFVAAAWRPAMVAVAVVVLATSGGTFVAAHEALPGDRLYAVKLLGEGVRERLMVTAEQRFVVQAAHAARRLDETERLLERHGLGDGLDARIRTTMNRYEGHLFDMNVIAARMQADPDKPRRGVRALRATDAVLERQARLLDSVSDAEPSVAAYFLEPADAAVSLEADVHAALPGLAGPDGSARREERAGKMGESLLRLRTELGGRFQPMPLEVPALP